jgi:hypothetical protein
VLIRAIFYLLGGASTGSEWAVRHVRADGVRHGPGGQAGPSASNRLAVHP